MSMIELLNVMRNHGGPALTSGLSDEILRRFAEREGVSVFAVLLTIWMLDAKAVGPVIGHQRRLDVCGGGGI